MKHRLLTIINEMLEESGRPTLPQLREAMHLRDDLQLDSFMLAELTVRVEAESGIDLFEEGLVHTIADLYERLGIEPSDQAER